MKNFYPMGVLVKLSQQIITTKLHICKWQQPAVGCCHTVGKWFFHVDCVSIQY
jgi:hypothetical protein